MMTRSLEDVYTYEKQALDLLNKDHPHYNEIKVLLTDEINDEIEDLCQHQQRLRSKYD